MANRSKSSCKLAWNPRTPVLKKANHSFQFYWASQVNGEKVISAHRRVPNQQRMKEMEGWPKQPSGRKDALLVSSASWENSHFAPEAARHSLNSWAVVSLNQCFGLMWDALWSTADQAKYERGVIFEQLMSLPEQIAWKQPQWLALILKPSLAQINSLQLEGWRKLLIFTHLFIFRQKIKQLGTVMICPWCSSCKHVSTCKTSLHRLNWKRTWDCGNFPTEYIYSMKESYGQANCFFREKLLKTTILMKTKDGVFTQKFLLNLCFYKTLNNSMEVKHCDLSKIAGMLNQIFAIGCSDTIRAKSVRISIS